MKKPSRPKPPSKKPRVERRPEESAEPSPGASSRQAVAASLAAPSSSRARLLGFGGLCLAGVAIALSCRDLKTSEAQPVAPQTPPVASATEVPQQLSVRVHASYPHDTQAFTQGLLWDRGHVLESTGLNGKSSLREVALDTGEVLRRVDNDSRLFAEGLALVGDTLIQLTWQNEVALVFDRDDFTQNRTFRYRGEGWGLCHDGRELVMSDGSATLSYRDAQTFALKRKVSVTRAGRPQAMLNELECVEGKVYANVWQTDQIVRIAADGKIDAVIDAKELLTPSERVRADVLNGIAYMKERGHFLVTGKHWPRMFEVTFEPAR